MDISFLYEYLYTKITSTVFDKFDIKRYVEDVVSFLELNDYLNDIIFLDDKYFNLASYNFRDKHIKIAIKAITNEARMMVNMMEKKPNTELMINLFMLETLIHEIHHIYHNYLVSESNTPISEIFYNELNYFYMDDPQSLNDYNAHYNQLIFERDANISAIENILKIILKYANDELIFNFYFDELRNHILSGYLEKDNSIISPLEVVYKDLLHYDMISVSNIDLYDRLKLGFQVRKEEFDYFKNSFKEIVLSKNNLRIY